MSNFVLHNRLAATLYDGGDFTRPLARSYADLVLPIAQDHAHTETAARLRVLGADMQRLCIAAIGKANRAKVVENITKYRAMADAYGNAAELLWAEAEWMEGDPERRDHLRLRLGLEG